jgi:hypothetical protein
VATPASLPESRIANRDRAPTPSSLREQMEQCVTLTASDDYGAALEGAARVRVKAKNACDVAFAWEEIWVEVTARPLSGAGVLGRTVGRLFSEIRPRGEGEGVMLVSGVSSGPFKRLEVTFWWAAGGGKKPGSSRRTTSTPSPPWPFSPTTASSPGSPGRSLRTRVSTRLSISRSLYS